MRLPSGTTLFAAVVVCTGTLLTSHGVEAESRGRVGRDKKKGLKSKMNKVKKEKKDKKMEQDVASVVIGGKRLIAMFL